MNASNSNQALVEEQPETDIENDDSEDESEKITSEKENSVFLKIKDLSKNVNLSKILTKKFNLFNSKNSNGSRSVWLYF